MIVWKSKDVPANALLHNWNYAPRVFARLHVVYTNGADGRSQWIQPPKGTLKCNTNAAVFQKANMTTWVAMLRDSIGSFVGCCFGFGDGCMKANMVEALAVREAPSWLKDKIIAAIIMETNCPTVIEACTNPAEDDSEMGIGS
ncbi:hypothetical protein Gorai_000997 [Gossypium raimondii]|uniref:RNase H type-1 domain-containing protein n=1 Tax=Gossypium raimondii TaxID=29730 RepID=A0A0D2S3D8_GOSRA|nr:hypothetical protein B456_006G144000 [Gossypium raimondii]MBA0587876.1 hypothetical protein [Gossypium raimondii]